MADEKRKLSETEKHIQKLVSTVNGIAFVMEYRAKLPDRYMPVKLQRVRARLRDQRRAEMHRRESER